jgi:hypothetical protein
LWENIKECFHNYADEFYEDILLSATKLIRSDSGITLHARKVTSGCGIGNAICAQKTEVAVAGVSTTSGHHFVRIVIKIAGSSRRVDIFTKWPEIYTNPNQE